VTKGWLDTLLDRGNEAKAKTAAPQMPVIGKPRQPKPEIKTVWVQTHAPQKPGDPGGCEAGYYSVVDGAVIMRDAQGKRTGQQQALGSGDDARAVAGRLTLEAIRKSRGTSDFNRPLGYARGGYA
jgi:hypothetical protein